MLPATSVSIERQTDGVHTIHLLSYTGIPGERFDQLEWDLGGGSKIYGETVAWAFDQDGSREIQVRAFGSGGRLFASPPIRIETRKQGRLQAGETTFLVVDKPDGLFALPGRIAGFVGETRDPQVLAPVSQSGEWTLYRSSLPGFFSIDVLSQDARYEVNLFVSPVASRQRDRSDVDWYRTQFGTETTSNCGPTVVSMGIAWARGIDVPVVEVRRLVGWEGTGAVDFGEMQAVLSRYGVSSRIVTAASAQVIFDMIDHGSIVGLLYGMEGLPRVDRPEQNLIGQYYEDQGGHYLAVKGYSLDRKYFVVYDPIPSDWEGNGKRYADGSSMFGRNRYYPVGSLMAAMRTSRVLEISR